MPNTSMPDQYTAPMDLTTISARARFRVGDRVRMQAGDTWVITGRYWRRSTREIVYDLHVARINYTVRKPEHLLRTAPEGE